jgi:putative ABC transport system ATP-binding protein
VARLGMERKVSEVVPRRCLPERLSHRRLMFGRRSERRSSTSDGRVGDATAQLPPPPVHAIQLDAVTKVYGKGNSAVRALRGVSIAIAHGTLTAVMGPSGSGRSTLLHVAAGLDRPSDGRVSFGMTELSKVSETRLTELRRDRIGFVFQAFNLLPSLTVEQNVTLPLRLAGRRADARAVTEVLDRVGLSKRKRHRPSELSGGEQQRCPRAGADHPAGGAIRGRADRRARSAHRQGGARIIPPSRQHPRSDGRHGYPRSGGASYADSVVFLADGQIVGSLRSPTAESVAERMTAMTDGRA